MPFLFFSFAFFFFFFFWNSFYIREILLRMIICIIGLCNDRWVQISAVKCVFL
uniref:Uncharacterized protein MANES_02G102200 n=1 Tax=Rhizophora mucronata TaxID=61149 RepID=A0A2P2MHA4_RHIMU